MDLRDGAYGLWNRRAIITRFPDAATIRRWHETPPYQALIPLRVQAVEMALIGYEPFD